MFVAINYYVLSSKSAQRESTIRVQDISDKVNTLHKALGRFYIGSCITGVIDISQIQAGYLNGNVLNMPGASYSLEIADLGFKSISIVDVTFDQKMFDELKGTLLNSGGYALNDYSFSSTKTIQRLSSKLKSNNLIQAEQFSNFTCS